MASNANNIGKRLAKIEATQTSAAIGGLRDQIQAARRSPPTPTHSYDELKALAQALPGQPHCIDTRAMKKRQACAYGAWRQSQPLTAIAAIRNMCMSTVALCAISWLATPYVRLIKMCCIMIDTLHTCCF